MNRQKQQDLAAVVAAIVAQAPPLTREQAFALSAMFSAAPACERRPAQAAAAPADTAARVDVGGRGEG